MKKSLTLIVCYTDRGKEKMQAIEEILTRRGRDTVCLERPSGKDWVSYYWDKAGEILFIGAAGIAVRLIAPCLQDKMKDPAVVVMDEKGTFAIPILSGHVGGANELALLLAEETGSLPVLTTATDVQGKFAVDVFAKKQSLLFSNRVLAKKISAAILRGEKIGFYTECPVEGELPEELESCPREEMLKEFPLGIAVVQSPDGEGRKDLETSGSSGAKILYLYPANLTLGAGCKKGKPAKELEDFFCRSLKSLGLRKEQVEKIGSIDRKEEEEGFIELADQWNIPFETWPEEVLKQIENVSRESGFVRQVTGIGNVCERAAIQGSKNGRLLLEKTAENGMTLAVAAKDWSVAFDEIICSRHRAGKL